MILKKILCVIISTLSFYCQGATLDANDAKFLAALRSAAETEDYINYRTLLMPLGLKSSAITSDTRVDNRTKPPIVYGQEEKHELALDGPKVFSSYIKKAELTIFQSVADSGAVVDLDMNINFESTCITRESFSQAFSPVQRIGATDFAPDHLEREIKGPKRRVIAIMFANNGCASKIVMTQR